MYIIGAGGLGREMASLLSMHDRKTGYAFKAFIDDSFPVKKSSGGFPIVGNLDALFNWQPVNLLFGIGNPLIRQQLFNKLDGLNHRFPAIIASGVCIHNSSRVKISDGCYIADGCVLTTDISVGRFSIILPNSTISHDTSIGDFCTLMSGVKISSGAIIGNNVYIGTGTIIAKPVSIADGSKIAAGTIIE